MSPSSGQKDKEMLDIVRKWQSWEGLAVRERAVWKPASNTTNLVKLKSKILTKFYFVIIDQAKVST